MSTEEKLKDEQLHCAIDRSAAYFKNMTAGEKQKHSVDVKRVMELLGRDGGAE